jgi:DNA-binding NarL/FixJ family response regulator
VGDPIRVALVDDYQLVLLGVTHMFDSYRDRVAVADISAGEPIHVPVDTALWDTFAQPEADRNDFGHVLDNPLVSRLVVYSWNTDPHLVDAAFAKGASGYVSKAATAAELVDALERIHAGERVVSPDTRRSRAVNSQDWPGRVEGLTERESEILALITQGFSNADIAAMTFLSINSVKTYIRSAYRKMGVASRTQAVLWGIEHGFRPPGR